MKPLYLLRQLSHSREQPPEVLRQGRPDGRRRLHAPLPRLRSEDVRRKASPLEHL